MTSLIFGSIYLGHKQFTEHRREKQRVKNYERWEGLRDEYDEQRRIGRESRSLDIQRTGSWGEDQANTNNSGYTNGDGFGANDRPILTLRDQQEAHDARTSWRPQEMWDGPKTQLQAQMTGMVQQQPTSHGIQRHVSTPAAPMVQPQHSTGHLPLRSQKTGATWDEGMPEPLRVTRQSFNDYDHRNKGRTASVPGRYSPGLNSTDSRRSSGDYDRRPSVVPHTPSGLRESFSDINASSSRGSPVQPPPTQQAYQQKAPMFNLEPVESHVPGGRMAELIERGF